MAVTGLMRHALARLPPRCIPTRAPPASASSAASDVATASACRAPNVSSSAADHAAADDGDAPEQRRVRRPPDRLRRPARDDGRARRQQVLEREDHQVRGDRRRRASRSEQRDRVDLARPASARRRAAATQSLRRTDWAIRSIAAVGPCQRSRASPCANRNPVYDVARTRHDHRPAARASHVAESIPNQPAASHSRAERAVRGEEPRAPHHPRRQFGRVRM